MPIEVVSRQDNQTKTRGSQLPQATKRHNNISNMITEHINFDTV